MDYTPNEHQKFSKNFYFRNQNSSNDIMENNLYEPKMNYNRQMMPQKQTDLEKEKELLELKLQRIRNQEFDYIKI